MSDTDREILGVDVLFVGAGPGGLAGPLHLANLAESPGRELETAVIDKSGEIDAVIIALADQPMINAQDITALIAAYKSRGDAALVVPPVDGEPGNPVMADAALKDEWLAGGAELLGRRWREANPTRVHWFDTDNQRYRIDIDTEADLQRFTERTGHELRWPDGMG